jgi:Tol biopolymer transport system component
VVAFTSAASNLVAGDTNRRHDIFVWNRTRSVMSRVSVDSAARQVYRRSTAAVVSSHGRFVSFTSLAERLVPNDTNGYADVFVHDLVSRRTKRVSVGSNEQEGEVGGSSDPAISGNGRFVAFQSWANGLVPRDTHSTFDVFVRDRWRGTTRLVSVNSTGEVPTNSEVSGWNPDISADGRFVVFDTYAQLTPAPPHVIDDVFIHDRVTGSTRLVSVPLPPSDDPCHCNGSSLSAAISADGQHITWWSNSGALVEGESDTIAMDIFARS